MSAAVSPAFWVAPDAPVQPAMTVASLEHAGTRTPIGWPVLTPTELETLATWLRTRRDAVLAGRTVAQIAEALDTVSARWLAPDFPPRRAALPIISAITGYSEAMVAHAIDLEMTSSRKGDLLGALDEELGSHNLLDGPSPTHYGTRRAFGPGLVGGVFSANIPALPHLTAMRALLVKAPCLGRVSRHEPVFLPMYAKSLADVDPGLASCLAVLTWDPADAGLEAAFLGAIDHLIAYGGDVALAALRSKLPPTTDATWHGHRMGFAVVLREALTPDGLSALAHALAYDFSVFDQHACLAPQAVFVEDGGAVSPHALAEAVASAMADWAQTLPPRRLAVEEATTLRAAVDRATVRSLMDPDVRVLGPARGVQGVVVLDPEKALAATPLDRFVRVVPLDDALVEVPALLRAHSGRLQGAAVAGVGPRLERLKATLARLGLNRLCPPGLMGTPSMRWRHDGHACLARLVRFCDDESRPPR